MRAVAVFVLAALLALPHAAPAAPGADLGAEIWKRRCAGCHGSDGNGGSRKLRPLTDPEVQAKSDAQLFDAVARGTPDRRMAGFRGRLSDAEIRAAVQHLRGLKR